MDKRLLKYMLNDRRPDKDLRNRLLSLADAENATRIAKLKRLLRKE